MAKYLALIYGDAKTWSSASAQWQETNSAGHRAFNAAAGPAVLLGAQLAEASTATTLRLDGDGRPSTTDGPFQETKEVLGGFYLLEAVDLDQAIALAWQIPEAKAGHSGVEVRPIVDNG